MFVTETLYELFFFVHTEASTQRTGDLESIPPGKRVDIKPGDPTDNLNPKNELMVRVRDRFILGFSLFVIFV